MKQRIFCDMDGVLAEFNEGASLEELFSPGYFRYLPPLNNMVEAIRLLTNDPDVEIFVLSHVLTEQAAADKSEWLAKHLPEIKNEHQIFVPYGGIKSEHISDGILTSDVLLDDFTQNLRLWSGIAIKVLNGINFRKKTWKGHIVLGLSEPNTIATAIRAISKYEYEIRSKTGA